MFWSAVRHVDRIRAHQELRDLNVAVVAAATAQGEQEAMPALRQALMEQSGEVTHFTEKISTRDEIMALIQETIV